MCLRNHTYFTSFLILLFLLSACRNAPKLPMVAADTEVNIHISKDPRGLNYLINYDSDALTVMKLMNVQLLGINPTTYALEPALAKALPIKEEIKEGEYAGLLSYTFEIRDEAVWDDGTPVTGKDMLFTVKATFNPHYRSPYAGQFTQIKNVVIDPNNPKKFTVYHEKYVIAEPSIGTFLLLPAHRLDPNGAYEKYSLTDLQQASNKEQIASDAALKEVADIFTSPNNMGQEGALSFNGPYRLKNWTTGQELVLEKKENWWGEQLATTNPHLQANPKKIVFKIIPDINAAMSLMRNGEIDVIKTVPYAEFKRIQEDEFFKENYNFYSPTMFRHSMLLLNNNDPRLSDKKVRRALAHLVDLEDIYESVYYGSSNPVATPIHPSKSTYHKGLPIIKYNVEKAKTLLQEAGWSDSNNNGVLDKRIDGSLQELNLKFSYLGSNSTLSGIGQVLKEKTKSGGVNIELVPMEGRPLITSFRQKTYELSAMSSSWVPYHKDLHQRWHTQGASNYPSFGNAASDALIEEIQKTVDEDKLKELYLKIQEVIYEEQPVIFINVGDERLAIHKKFGDILPTSLSPGFFLHQFSETLVTTK